MKTKVMRLNKRLLAGEINPFDFEIALADLLRPLDWQRRIKYQNLAVL